MPKAENLKYARLSRHDTKVAKAEKKSITAEHFVVFRAIQDDDGFCKKLVAGMECGDHLGPVRLIAERYKETKLFEGEAGANAMHNLLSWAGKADGGLNGRIANLMWERVIAKAKYHSTKRKLVTAANLNLSAVNKDLFYSKIPKIAVIPLATPFPPPYLYVLESERIYKKNMKFVLECDLPDDRKWWKLIYQLKDSTKLTYDLPPSESAVFVDSNEKIVAVVICNACGHKEVLEFLDSAVQKVVATQNNVRVCEITGSFKICSG